MRTFFILLLSLFAVSSCQNDRAPTDAKDVLELNLKATGGKDNWENIETYTIKTDVLITVASRPSGAYNEIINGELPDRLIIKNFSNNILQGVVLNQSASQAFSYAIENDSISSVVKIEALSVPLKPG